MLTLTFPYLNFKFLDFSQQDYGHIIDPPESSPERGRENLLEFFVFEAKMTKLIFIQTLRKTFGIC